MPGLSSVVSDYDECCALSNGFVRILDNRRNPSFDTHRSGCVVSHSDDDDEAFVVQVGCELATNADHISLLLRLVASHSASLHEDDL